MHGRRTSQSSNSVERHTMHVGHATINRIASQREDNYSLNAGQRCVGFFALFRRARIDAIAFDEKLLDDAWKLIIKSSAQIR